MTSCNLCGSVLIFLQLHVKYCKGLFDTYKTGLMCMCVYFNNFWFLLEDLSLPFPLWITLVHLL